MNIIQKLISRGFVYQCTDIDTLKKISREKITVYSGFDCTSDSLHVGHLLQIMMLRHIKKAGNKIILLVGGATTKIGDPSGKNKTRKLLDDKKIEENLMLIINTFSKFFNLDNEDIKIVNNNIWLSKLNYLEFLKNYGRYFSINKMISFQNIKNRLQKNEALNFSEFSYMLLQAYDFYSLYKSHKCILQIGGSDQWSNIINGIELIKKIVNKKVFGLTTHLLTTKNGNKMGKSEKGAIWLNSRLLSDYDYWQFWRNIDDHQVIKFMKLFTELPLDYIEELKKTQNINQLKIILADEVTEICRGKLQTKNAKKIAHQIFISPKCQNNILPRYIINIDDLTKTILLYKLIVQIKMISSHKKSKHLIISGAVKINDIKHFNPNYHCNIILNKKQYFKLSIGKKRHLVISLNKEK